MAKKIVLLTGSPRRKGNTVQMGDALAAALEEKDAAWCGLTGRFCPRRVPRLPRLLPRRGGLRLRRRRLQRHRA